MDWTSRKFEVLTYAYAKGHTTMNAPVIVSCSFNYFEDKTSNFSCKMYCVHTNTRTYYTSMYDVIFDETGNC